MLLDLVTPPLPRNSETSSRPLKPRFNLSLRMGCDPRTHQSCVTRQFATYPYRLSRELRLDATDPRRAYLYIMNTSPGLFAGDDLRVAIALDARTQLHLTDQAATKVHCMPSLGSLARMDCQIQIGDCASLEYVPEPLILYEDSTLEQTTQITLASTGQLFLSEMILPGRLAQAEYYDFRSFQSRVEVKTPEGKILLKDVMRLQGQGNPLIKQAILSELPIMASMMTVVPDIELKALIQQLQTFPKGDRAMYAGHSVLPQENGLLIRAIADRTSTLKGYIRFCLNQIRQLTHQPELPEIPK